MSWLQTRREALDGFLAPLFQDAWPASFAEPQRYPLFGGGKRMRPALCFAAYEAIRGPDADLGPVMPAAAAIELIHTYSLVHDDLPAMDDDDERRGRPTVHKAYDEATAILVGDSLLTEAFGVLTRAQLPAETVVNLMRRLSNAAGYRGMVGGQAADVGGHGDDEASLTRLHRLKTGALFEYCVAAGGITAGATAMQRDALDRFGAAMGLAFQLADDLLDLEEDQGEGGPPNFPRLIGADETARRAQEQLRIALDAAGQLPHPQALQALARYTVERDV